MSSTLSYHVFRFPRLLVACVSTSTTSYHSATPLPYTATDARAAVLFFSISSAAGSVFGFNLRGSCPAHDHTHTPTHSRTNTITRTHTYMAIPNGQAVAPKYDSETQTRPAKGFRVPPSKETAEAA